MKESVWKKTANISEFEKLHGDVKTDVLIIGGGICGILCAYFLKKAGVECILVEGKRLASGITKNTTAKITSQHGLIYDKLMSSFGEERAKMYLDANEDAVREYEKLCEKIDCEFEKRKSYVFSMAEKEKLQKEVSALERLGYIARLETTDELPFKTEGAVCFKNQAQFNPLKFISAIVKDLNIFENTFIRDITPHSAISENGRIIADKIIVATHFPFINKHGSYFLKLYQHRSYVSAFENVKPVSGMYVDEDLKGLSLREYNGLLLIGGGSHRTGKKGGAWEEIQAFAKKYYPDAKLKFQWATQDCMSLDGVPYIGQYSARTPNLFVATGFNKWGITSAMAAAKILCDKVLDKENDYAEVFSPQRSILKPQLLVNTAETTLNFLTPTIRRCPHLGCALKWNKQEHTWDCPCHGSRFNKAGKLIDNPATGDADIKQQ